jgi:hypothetical protein
VTIERTIAYPTAVVKANTTWREFPTAWRMLLDDVWAFLRATPGLRADGHNVMVYTTGLANVEVAVEIGVQVTRSFVAAGRVVPSTLPAGEAATTVHQGPPSELGAAHHAVRTRCSARHRCYRPAAVNQAGLVSIARSVDAVLSSSGHEARPRLEIQVSILS